MRPGLSGPFSFLGCGWGALSACGARRQNGRMDAVSTSAPRPSGGKRAAGAARRRTGSPKAAVRTGLAWRRGLLMAGVAGVFVAAFMVDTAGMARLIWACLAGREGPAARMVALAVLVPVLGVVVVAFWRPGERRPAPAAPRKKAVRAAGRTKAVGETVVGPKRAKGSSRKPLGPGADDTPGGGAAGDDTVVPEPAAKRRSKPAPVPVRE